ncbi:MAG: hypothetical protein U5K72_03325 [Balneolaceae bacterium]|nr:hypothetical protein [Balneolaceae bacterium]
MCSDNFFEITPYKYPPETLALYLSSTVACFYKELLGRSNFGGGLLKTQKPDLQKIDVVKDLKIDKSIQFASNIVESIFKECGINPESEVPISEQEPNPLPDRAELDNIVFDALGLTEEERKEVYRAVCQLVWNRVSKARSV